MAGSKRYFQARERSSLARTPEGRAFMNQVGDGVPKAGDLSRTLWAVSKNGARYMYTGNWGRQSVEAVQTEGGKAIMEDMRRYRPIWEEPLSTTFLGPTIFAPGKSSDGGCQVGLHHHGTAALVTVDSESGVRRSPETPGVLNFAESY
jgi:gamma-glutamyltranspeptidase